MQALGVRLEKTAERGPRDREWAQIAGVAALAELLGERHPQTTTIGTQEFLAILNFFGGVLRTECPDGWADDPEGESGPRPRYSDAYGWRQPRKRRTAGKLEPADAEIASLLDVLGHLTAGVLGYGDPLATILGRIAGEATTAEMPTLIPLPTGVSSEQVGYLIAALFATALVEFAAIVEGDQQAPPAALPALLAIAERSVELFASVVSGDEAAAAVKLGEIVQVLQASTRG